MWVDKKIKSSKDCELRTPFDTYFLSKGEVRTVRFKNQRSFDTLLKKGKFVEAKADEPEVKDIPIIPIEFDDDEIKVVEPEIVEAEGVAGDNQYVSIATVVTGNSTEEIEVNTETTANDELVILEGNPEDKVEKVIESNDKESEYRGDQEDLGRAE